jgi:hypothetical protein
MWLENGYIPEFMGCFYGGNAVMLTIVSSLHTISVFLCYMLSTHNAVTAKYKLGVF